MAERSEKATEILDIAEQMARQGGYNGFSFREIASEAGIKSASVHYHFPTKENLGVALARRYTDQFIEKLGAPENQSSLADGLSAYVEAYRQALVEDGLMCLCGMLGSEIAALPGAVSAEVKRFFELNLNWLISVQGQFQEAAPQSGYREKAVQIVALLEGAMILSRTLGDVAVFEDATRAILKLTDASD